MRVLKKLGLTLVVLVFSFSTMGHHLPYMTVGTVSAQTAENKVDLVVHLVDDSIYGAIQGDLNWYVTKYIPKQLPGSKSLILPINVQ